ncbi:hypothetical protein EUTSA_v10011118mg [Eutrema salsugineum]|uniref:HAT C-terminal dimerisation domain-containing protein n=1 Tax=Eutrema salsugineum TaxID=72664 RepID=V4LTU6_EUTSA|nr:hypothetical protein EUTSA_v10011118mg [Eutrema salsugineum]
MMRRFTNQHNLHRPTVTRFATSFITLSQFHKQQNNLRKMVTSEEWNASKWPKEAGGKKLQTYLLQDTFWRHILYALKVTGPLVCVLRMVDGERKPPMGYIYAAMDKAKEAIANSFNLREEQYKKIFEIIDRRWDCQLHRPLHAAGHFLNPAIQYEHPDDVLCAEVENGLYKYIERLRQRSKKSPAEWWSCYGSSAPYLKNFAIKVLSLTCSATGCERSWGVFQLQSDTTDPILLEEIDESNDWLLGRMDGNSSDEDNDLVFEDDDLTWRVVS